MNYFWKLERDEPRLPRADININSAGSLGASLDERRRSVHLFRSTLNYIALSNPPTEKIRELNYCWRLSATSSA